MIKKYALIFTALLCAVVSGFGQATLPVNRTVWDTTPTGWTDSGTGTYLTTFACSGWNGGRLDRASAPYDYYEVYFDSTPDQLTFAIKISGSASSSLLVQESPDATTWTTVVSNVNLPTTCTTFNYNLLSTSRYVRFTYKKVAQNLTIDDVEITKLSTSPNLSVTPTAITGLNYVVGNGPSVAQSYQVSGTNLTPAIGNITVTAPTNFSISKTLAGTYTNSLTYAYTGGTLAASDVYVKLNAGLTIGTYGPLNITNAGGGATTQNVAISGAVTGSNNSDIVAVAASESATISSLINNPAPLTVAQGAQVWQFRVRDGGASLNDADNLPTVLTDFTLAQAAGNQIGTWTDAIETIALFDGATHVANGTVTANQIQFTGLNVSVTDGTQKTLSLRLSLKCPLGADAFDNEDFVFSLSNANTTFSAAGSGKTTFPAQTSANGQNRIDINATTLAFTTQPVDTGVNSPMSDVVISAIDTCGNKDVDFTGQVTITSSGSMSPIPAPANAVDGEITFTGIVHNVVAPNRQMTATTTTVGVSNGTSSLFDITNTTTLNRGDLAIIAVNVNTEVFSGAQSGQDEIAFVCFQDLLPGTTIYLTDNGYEREFADEWGGTEGVISITRTTSTLPKGTIIAFRSNTISGNVTNSSQFDIYTCGSLDSNWTKTAIGGGSVGGFNLNKDDDIWIMQGGTWTNNTNHHSTYTGGNVLYGWTESGWDSVPNGDLGNGSTKVSTIYPGLECFNTVAPVGAGYVKFNDPIDPDFSTVTNGRLDWIALINDTINWDTYANNTAYVSGGYDYLGNSSCPAMTIATTGYINGKWVGRADTNWFNCLNWDTLIVPDETVDVTINTNSNTNHANVDSSAPYANYYGNIAKSKNLTISGKKVEISGSASNILEVHGDLLINSTGALDMDDGNNATADGQIHLYGNWVNNRGTNAFLEGNSTVMLTGNTTQLIVNGATPIPPITTEEFYNLILNNDFNTSLSNALYMHGNLTVNSGRTLIITDGKYAYVNLGVTNNGLFNIENNGSLIQGDDNDVNTGNISMERSASVRNHDYVYWSSPITNYGVSNISSTSYIYKWNPTITNPNGGQGNWVSAVGDTMLPGVGYIVRGSNGQPEPVNSSDLNFTTTFNNGKPLNGLITVDVSRGSDSSNDDDDWNLVGNPYPSAIDAYTFLTNTTNSGILDGFVNVWTHGTLPSDAIADPFYDDFGANYTASDYIAYNALGSSAGPGDTTIGAGQSFMVNMLDGPTATQTIEFRNNMRDKSYDNSVFYRPSESSTLNGKGRIWLDLVSDSHPTNRILVGYIEGATQERDRLFDAITVLKNEQAFYSTINNKPFVIQGRALPFDASDHIPLGIQVTNDGNYTIAIAAVDGLFEADNQTIYLKDHLLGVTHNLTNQPYSFTSETGAYNNRFEIVFSNSLSVADEVLNPNNLSIVEQSNGEVIFTVNNAYQIKNVSIIDMLGRTLYKAEGTSNRETYNLSHLSQASYIAQVELSSGQVISKKMIKRH